MAIDNEKFNKLINCVENLNNAISADESLTSFTEVTSLLPGTAITTRLAPVGILTDKPLFAYAASFTPVSARILAESNAVASTRVP